MGKEMIRLQGVTKRYGNNQVLKGVDLSVMEGEIYGLIGKNGAGKTTIFKILLGLSVYDGGRISIDGGSNEKELREARKGIGFFIGKNFFDYMTARDNLKYYCILKGVKDYSEIDRVLDLVGLEGVNTKYKGFSMGMKQRLGIACALLGNPKILVLDEPVNGLDPQGIAEIRHLLQDINKKHGTTIIISSHILGEVEHTATRFGILNDGIIAREIGSEDLKIENNEINLTIPFSEVEKARNILQENGIHILDESRKGTSLEEYYFNLVGGDTQ